MRSFQHVETPLRIFSGEASLAGLDKELARLGSSRAVIVCGRTLSRGPLVDLVRQGMGGRCAGVFAGVKAHTPRPAVAELAEELRRLDADAIVAVGGGSAVVTARAAAVFLAEGDDLDALSTRRDAEGRMHSPRLNAPKIPQLVVPTTPNTAIVKAGSAVFDPADGLRKAVFDPKTRAQSIFLHPDFLLSAPRDLGISASLDTLTLALEGLLSKTGDAISDAQLIHAVRLLADALPRMMTHDSAGLRGDLAMAALLAGRGTDHTGAGACTVLGHAIGANHDVENGTAKAVVLPQVVRFNEGHNPAGFANLATALSLTADHSVAAINRAFAEVFTAIGAPTRLRDLGIPPEALPAIAERGMTDWFLQGNPRRVAKADDLLGILTAAW